MRLQVSFAYRSEMVADRDALQVAGWIAKYITIHANIKTNPLLRPKFLPKGGMLSAKTRGTVSYEGDPPTSEAESQSEEETL